MRDLATVLVEMANGSSVAYRRSIRRRSKPFDGARLRAEMMLATSEGKALAALVEAAEAWRDIWLEEPDDDEMDTATEDVVLYAAVDAYREATR